MTLALFLLRWWSGFLLLTTVRAQIRVLAPEGLAVAFKSTQGIVYGTTATFGAPYYGERVLGQLMYSKPKGEEHCTEADYDLPIVPTTTVDTSAASNMQDPVNVVIVHRGKCTFVKKVKIAQAKGAHAVIVVDKRDSTLTSKDIQRVVMSDDGSGHSIKIPSVLISRFEGQKLIEWCKKGPVVVELAWDIPRGEVVIADFWMSSGNQESTEFLERFRDSAEALKYHLQFVPHYHIFSLPKSGDGYGSMCHGADSKYCAPDPDGEGPVTGAEVVEEDVRQLCLWNLTARMASGLDPSENGVTYSDGFWDYVTLLSERCPVAVSSSTSKSKRFGTTCSYLVMKHLGVDTGKVQKCVLTRWEEFLDQQIEQVAWSPQALRLNGWRYSGPLDPETVLKAICSGYTETPDECNALLSIYQHRPPPWVNVVSSLSFGTFAWSVVGLVMAVVVMFYLYRRYETTSVRRAIREEVMLEVQTQMADYTEFKDSVDTPRRSLQF
eukprot:TRINITY_DN65436_c0_g1_i1.p1 TRINITY_DN65436_c0_g1~~TRINITY_DN65436_c0_g1_i1.p1  ORF type:complete len:494 (+),score=102.02 TRINITY_DN65436_c0_g1_i1:89-1570(+)